jgi:hypothetical protein
MGLEEESVENTKLGKKFLKAITGTACVTMTLATTTLRSAM